MAILTGIRTTPIIIRTVITISAVRWCVSLGPPRIRCQDGIEHASLLGEMPMRETGAAARRGWDAEVVSEGERKRESLKDLDCSTV